MFSANPSDGVSIPVLQEKFSSNPSGGVVLLVLQETFSSNPSEGVVLLVLQEMFSSNTSYGVSIPVLEKKICANLSDGVYLLVLQVMFCLLQVMISCLPYIQSVINPVIYVLMSKKIRDSVCSTPLARCLRSCCSSRQHVKHSPTHELLTATNHSAAVTGMKTSLETMRSYGASELTDV